ncbi:MAG: glutamate 5-kinase [Candidatus Omnitrophica bacterium]|nr:glutamate 5-kinase [Candidatus Omnitrophota bacterium]
MKAKRIVVKIGSSIFFDDKGNFAGEVLDSFARQISILHNRKYHFLIVSSGAIALGMSILGLHSRPKELSQLQAAAAIGQNQLMSLYSNSFKKFGLLCGQVLLTWDDFTQRKRYLNAKNTLEALLAFKIIPIINENDTVSTEEIKFGDNDQLSGLVATLIGAELLIILSDVDGLFDKDKKTVIRRVSTITPEIMSLASSTTKKTSVGGMATKLKAAKIATDSGIGCVIASGKFPDVLLRLAEDNTAIGTYFVPKQKGLPQRQRWIGFGARPKGSVFVDDGAKKALFANKSLLSVGVFRCCGNFNEGDVVSICDKEGKEFARGKVAISSKTLENSLGKRLEREVIHCDNLVILQ